MATRSFIGKVQQDGSVHGIYCHFDGYPEGVGAVLKKHYMATSDVDALLALGDLSELHPTLEKTVAYHRDRGEDLMPNFTYLGVDDLVEGVREDIGAEYVYLYTGGKWATYNV